MSPVSDPSWAPGDSGPLLQRRVLDRQVARLRRDDPSSWGPMPWLGPLLVTVAVIVAGQVVRPLVPTGGAGRVSASVLYVVLAEALIVASMAFFARGPAERAGGWVALLGLSAVRPSDWRPWLLGVIVAFVSRYVVAVVAADLTHGQAVSQSQNLRLTHPTHAQISVLLLTGVVVAPVVEEALFRGLLLRTFMRRLQFWPAAVLSTGVFAAFHTYEVSTVVGAVTLAAVVFTLGLTNCWLVRITGRLTPGMLVHATFNLLAVLVAVHRATA